MKIILYLPTFISDCDEIGSMDEELHLSSSLLSDNRNGLTLSSYC